MRPVGHVVTSAISAGIIGSVTQSPFAAVGCFLSGTLIDLDHVLDYYIFKGFTLSYKKFSQAMYKLELSHHLLIFHSYELLALFWSWIWIRQPGPVPLGICLGLSVHLCMDQIFNRRGMGTYFLVYRAFKKFRTAEVFKDYRVKEGRV